MRVLVAVVLAVGCASAAPRTDESSGSDEPVSEVDETDRCHELPNGCIEGLDPSWDDGCPAHDPPEIRFADGSALLDDEAERRIGWLVLDGRELAPGVTIRLVSVSSELSVERIAAVRAGLVRGGVPSERITEGGALPTSFTPPASTSIVVAADGCRTP